MKISKLIIQKLVIPAISIVIPAKAGIQGSTNSVGGNTLDPSLRWGDKILAFSLLSFAFLLSLISNLSSLPLAHAQVMQSPHYSMQEESVNFGGGNSKSASYSAEDTAGEVATGYSASADQTVHAGYQQTVPPAPVVPPVTPPANNKQAAGGSSSGGTLPLPNPSGFTAAPLVNGIALLWTNPTDFRFIQVRIIRSSSFFPGNESDGETIYQGTEQSYFDATAKAGVTYYYAIFAEGMNGIVSSGALAFARMPLPGEIAAATSSNPFVNVQQAAHVDPMIASLSLLDFQFIQDGKLIPVGAGGTVSVNGTEDLTVRLRYDRVPQILKTIALGLSDPADHSKAFIFLLRPNADKSYYEATMGPLGRSGSYPLTVSILDYQNQGLKQLSGSLDAFTAAALNSLPAGFAFGNYLWILAAILLAIIVAIIVWRRRKNGKGGNGEKIQDSRFKIQESDKSEIRNPIRQPADETNPKSEIQKDPVIAEAPAWKTTKFSAFDAQRAMVEDTDKNVSSAALAGENTVPDRAAILPTGRAVSDGTVLSPKESGGVGDRSQSIPIVVASLVIFALVFKLFSPIAYAAFNPEINYQGKLMDASGNTVADGSYNVEFKLYASLSGGAPIWTEDDLVSNGQGAALKSGLFSLMLGSTTPFTGVNFNQTLYLGVDIGGTANAPTPTWDGEMSPRKILGAVPAAFEATNAQALSGLNSSQFLRSDAQNATSSSGTFINVLQSGAGKIAEFFGQASQTVLSILSNGNVGVGTTSPFALFSVEGNSFVAGNQTASNFIATSSAASQLPYASTTALTIGALNGLLFGTNGAVSSIATSSLNLSIPLSSTTGTLAVGNGGTGLSSAPSYGNLLMGQSDGTYALTGTSSLGFLSFSTTSADYYANGSSTISKTSSSNTFTGDQTFNGANVFGGSATFNGNVVLSALTGLTIRCLQVGPDGTVAANPLGCGGAAAAAGSWSTTTSQVSGELVNYSNNTTDVIAIGNTSTTTAKFWFDPNAQKSFLSGLATLGNLLVSGSSTLQNFTFTNATGTAATTTSFFAATASSTNLYATNGNIGTLTVNGASALNSVSANSLTVSGATNLASSLNGILFGTNGAVSSMATSSLGIIAFSTTSANYFVNSSSTIAAPAGLGTSLGTGGLIQWNGSNWTSVSTTTLGLLGASSVQTGVAGQAAFYGANGANVFSTSTLVFGTTTKDANNIGIGTTSPYAKLSVQNNSSAVPQLDLAYDNTDYLAAVVNSVGALTLNLFGSTGGLMINNPQPASVATQYGTNATTSLLVTGATGGNTSYSTFGNFPIAGIGGGIILNGGLGGVSTNAGSGQINGGKGGPVNILGGTGGSENVVTGSGFNNGGWGGTVTIQGGNGGNASNNAAFNIAGGGGDLSLLGGNAGSASGGVGEEGSEFGGAVYIEGGYGPDGSGNVVLAASSTSLGSQGNVVFGDYQSLFDTTLGFLGIATTSPFMPLTVEGNGYFSGSLTAGDITATGTLTVGGLAKFPNLLSTGSSTLQNFTFVNATGTAATTTDFFAATASSTNLYATNGNIGTLTVNGASALNSVSANSLTLSSSLNGPLQANAGVVSATTSVGVLYGGTGLTSIASSSLLIGNAVGGYTQYATSSLGILSATTSMTLAQTYGTAQTGNIWLGTSTGATNNGLTTGIYITNTGSSFSFQRHHLGNLSLRPAAAPVFQYAKLRPASPRQRFEWILHCSATSSLGLLGSSTVSSLTNNYLPKWNSNGTFTNSLIFDNGTNVGIGSSTPWAALSIGVPNWSATAPMFAISSSTSNGTTTPFEVNNNGSVVIGSLTGPLQAISGVVSATTSIGVLYGGTGQTSFGQGWLGINNSGAFISSTSPTVNYIVSTSTTATSTFAGRPLRFHLQRHISHSFFNFRKRTQLDRRLLFDRWHLSPIRHHFAHDRADIRNFPDRQHLARHFDRRHQ